MNEETSLVVYATGLVSKFLGLNQSEAQKGVSQHIFLIKR